MTFSVKANRIEDISYAVVVSTAADQSKLDLLHKNLMKHCTIYNTIKSGTKQSGTVTAVLGLKAS